MRRREIILDKELTPGPGQMVLLNRDGHFGRLQPGEVALPGQVVAVYDIDLTNDDDLVAANKLFTADYYPSLRHGPWEDEQKIINEFIPESGATVLEVCCGAGRVAPALIRGGNTVTAVDISEECIRHAAALEAEAAPRENRQPVDYRVGDVLQLPFADRSFDVGCVMENSIAALFRKRRRALSELVRVCRQRIVMGLREVPGAGDEILTYTSAVGFFEFSLSHSLDGFRQFLDLFPKPPHYRSGLPRPWGGREWFLIFDL